MDQAEREALVQRTRSIRKLASSPDHRDLATLLLDQEERLQRLDKTTSDFPKQSNGGTKQC